MSQPVDPQYAAPPPGWQPPPGSQPPPGWQPPAPPQKKHTVRNILLIILGLFFLMGACSAMLGGGSDTTDNASSNQPAAEETKASKEEPAEEQPKEEEPKEEEPKEEEPAEPAAPGIGTSVRDGKFEFTVTRVENVGKTVGEDFLQETAQGEFVIVYVNVSNIGDRGQTLDSSSQVLLDDQGRQFNPSSAMFTLEGADKAFLENINPGNTVTDVPLLFDVAPGTVLSEIELHDSMFSGGVKVKLS